MKVKLFNRFFTLLLMLVVLYSCESEHEFIDSKGVDPQAVHFVSQVNSMTLQRSAVNSTWENGDRIGVFMKSTGSTLSGPNIIGGASNMVYKTSGDGYFSPNATDQTIYYPTNGSSVDFIAYYPYQSSITSYTYNVDVSDQTSQQAIDLLYSNNVVNESKSNRSGALNFTHQLAKLHFSVKASSTIENLTGLEVTIADVKTLASFNLADGSLVVNSTSTANVKLKTTVDGNTADAEAILIPDNGGVARIVTFKLPSVGTFKWTIPSDTKLEKGRKYTYSITLKADGVIVEPLNGWVETPAVSNLPTNLTYISHMMPGSSTKRNYAMLYDTENRLAHWVAYPMHSSYLGGSGRTDDWGYDPKVSQALQPYLKNGFGVSQTDRGHQIPSADRTFSTAVNATTFYYTNMTAQHSMLNQHMWRRLEERIRVGWMPACDTLYVVTGAAITTKSDSQIDYVTDNKGKNVARPKYYYKALAQRVGNKYYTVAFKMDNKSFSTSENYDNYRITVKELEQEVGFTFFPSIPEADKNQIVTSKWN